MLARKVRGDYTPKFSATIKPVGYNPGRAQERPAECDGALRGHNGSGARRQHAETICRSSSNSRHRAASGISTQSNRSKAERPVLSNPGPVHRQQSPPRSATHEVLELRIFHSRSYIRDALRRASAGGMGECASRRTFPAHRPHHPRCRADKPAVRTVVHLHGAKTRPESDGYPEDWIVPGKSSLYYYPNQQDAAMLWYHDHALGINRLNVYAGLLGAFFIRDGVEDALNLPKGKYELPLILYDRLLTHEGQLLYPVSPDPQSPWVPEIFGNAILVNGKLFPYLEVEPRKISFARAERFQRALLQSVIRRQCVDERSSVSSNRDRSGFTAHSRLAQEFRNLSRRARRSCHRFQRPSRRATSFKSDAIVVLQFRVSPRKVADTSSLPQALRPLPKIPESQAVQKRLLTLNEYVNKAGNPVMLLLNASHWKRRSRKSRCWEQPKSGR